MREITAGKLSKILEEHERWLDTNGDEGEKANLRKADLSDANLSNADLSGAYLNEADLRGAYLNGANLYKADLSEVLDLNIEQLSEVETLYKTKLDPELKKQVKDKYPHLLEKPEDYEEEEEYEE